MNNIGIKISTQIDSTKIVSMIHGDAYRENEKKLALYVGK